MSVDIYVYHRERGLQTSQGVDSVPERGAGQVIWVDIEGEDLNELNAIAKHFSLHELAIEDCLTPSHFPKIEDYQDYLFIILRGLKPLMGLEAAIDGDDVIDEDEDKYTRKVAIFLAPDFVVTYRRKEVPWLDAVLRQVGQRPDKALQSTASFAHRIIDVLMTRFARTMGYFEDLIQDHERKLLNNDDEFSLGEVFELKHELVNLRQMMRDQRGIFQKLATEPALIKEKIARQYFRDVDDLAVAVNHVLDQHISSIDSIKDSYFAIANVRLGDTMRVLAVITTIGVPLHLVTGYFGMNFQNLPLLHSPNGFLYATLVMLGLSVTLILFFRKQKWM